MRLPVLAALGLALLSGGGSRIELDPRERDPASYPVAQEVTIDSVDPRDAIEALFLGEGPLQASRVGCFRQGEMRGWPVGTTLRILVAPAVTETQLVGIRQTVAQLASATLGALHASIRRVDEVDPRPHADEISIAVLPEDMVRRSCGGAAGCAIGRYSLPFFRSVRIVAVDDADAESMAHEVGHGAFGLCHIHAPEGLRPSPLMGAGGAVSRPHQPELEPLSFKAVQAVYRARLTAGATRRQFAAAGLIKPARPRARAGAEGEGMVMVDGGGGEIAIMKPFCPAPRGQP